MTKSEESYTDFFGLLHCSPKASIDIRYWSRTFSGDVREKEILIIVLGSKWENHFAEDIKNNIEGVSVGEK